MRGNRESLDAAIIGKRGFRLKKKIPNRTIFLARSFERICGRTEIVSLFFIFSNRGDAGCRKSAKTGFVSMFSLVMVSPTLVPSCARLQSQKQGASCKSMGQTSTKSDRSSRMIFFGFGFQRKPTFRHSRESGNDEGGRSRRFESQERKTTDLLHARLKIEPFKDFGKRLGLPKLWDSPVCLAGVHPPNSREGLLKFE
jgi:hypothetical protein